MDYQISSHCIWFHFYGPVASLDVNDYLQFSLIHDCQLNEFDCMQSTYRSMKWIDRNSWTKIHNTLAQWGALPRSNFPLGSGPSSAWCRFRWTERAYHDVDRTAITPCNCDDHICLGCSFANQLSFGHCFDSLLFGNTMVLPNAQQSISKVY